MPHRPGVWIIAACSILIAARAGAAQITKPTEKLTVSGLRAPVELVRDRFGIVHIYAGNEHDLFMAQGYSAARDRLFQLELWRRQAIGATSEILGSKGLARDAGARLLRFRGDIKSELAHYHPRGAAIVAAFVEGINAYIALTEREPGRLPLEFRVLGLKPGPWTSEIVVSRHNGLFGNVTREVRNAQLVRLIGPERARELLNLHPGQPSLEPEVDLALIPEDVLNLYYAYRAPITFEPEDVLPEFHANARTKPAADHASFASWALDLENESAMNGSNNWVIAPERTFTRSAIMANDPHRTIGVPSLRYWVHLVAPGWNVIGGGEPALPGVSIGHNENGAWGFTIFPIDQEDLFILETDPADPSRYRVDGAWETMTETAETIAIKGREPIAVKLQYSRFGPVLRQDPAHHRAYALKAVWHEIGTAPYLASLRIDQASSWAEFREACKWFYTPDENMVWADVDGHIGWQAVGLAPRREKGNGLLPAPADGGHEWKGWLPALDLPSALDPPKGWFASANQDNLPRGYPFAVGYEWTDPYRFSRIEEVLAQDRRVTLADMRRLQQDWLSIPARSLIAMLGTLNLPRNKVGDACRKLVKWDCVLDPESAEAALYVSWERKLKEAVWNLVAHREVQKIIPWKSYSTERMIQVLESPDGRFGADPVAARDALVLTAMAHALNDVAQREGGDPLDWLYGDPRFKHVTLKHPLSAAVNNAIRARLDLGPLPRGGAAHTVNSTTDNDNQTAGASFRIIADTGDWDRSLGTNAPGQSGDPTNHHYRDLFEPWTRGGYFPAFYSRAKVDSVTESVLDLVP